MALSQEFDSELNDDFERAIGAAREGEHRVLGVLLDVYRGYLLSIADKKLSRGIVSKVAPSDLVQETLLKATRSFGEFHGSSELELRSWLKRILERQVVDTYRYYREYARRDVSREVPFREQVCEHVPQKMEDSNFISLEGTADNVKTLSKLLTFLNDEQRMAVQLRTFDRLSFEQVGKQLGRSTEAARKIWTRAIQKMTQEFRSHEAGKRSDSEIANRVR